MPITHAAHADPITATDYEADHEGFRYSADSEPATAISVGHEFLDGTHGSFAWAPSAPAVDDDDLYPGYLKVGVTDTTVRYLSKAWTPGATDVTVTVGFDWAATSNLMHVGIYVGDTTGVLEGAGGNMVLFQFNFGLGGSYVDAYKLDSGSFSAFGSSQSTGYPWLSGRAYLRLTRVVSGPTWQPSFSFDGRVWAPYGTTSDKSLTVGAIGLRVACDNGQGHMAIPFIRGWDAVIEKIGS